MWTALLLLKTFYLVGGKSVYRRLFEFWKIFAGGSKREGRSRVHFSQVIPAAKGGPPFGALEAISFGSRWVTCWSSGEMRGGNSWRR
jgi:hypothetical protein